MRNLNAHPRVFIPTQEMHFFDNDEHYAKGLRYYSSQVVHNNRNKPVLGEKTPHYMFSDHVPKRIFEMNPNAQIVFFLRNPIDRAFSAFEMDFQKNAEPQVWLLVAWWKCFFVYLFSYNLVINHSITLLTSIPFRMPPLRAPFNETWMLSLNSPRMAKSLDCNTASATRWPPPSTCTYAGAFTLTK